MKVVGCSEILEQMKLTAWWSNQKMTHHLRNNNHENLTTHIKMNYAAIKKTLASIPVPKNEDIHRSNTVPKDTVLLDYLQKTLQDTAKIIIISCFDNASTHFAKLNPVLKKVGLKETLTDCFRCSYIAVFSKNKVYFEENGGEKPIHKILNISDVRFLVSSGGYDVAICEILINDLDLSSPYRGLNFVIFNAKTKQVEDVFNVDFHGDEKLKINRF